MQQLTHGFTYPITIFYSDDKKLLDEYCKKLYSNGKEYFQRLTFLAGARTHIILNNLKEIELYLYRLWNGSSNTEIATIQISELIDKLNSLAIHQDVFISRDKYAWYKLSSILKDGDNKVNEIFMNEQLIEAATILFHLSKIASTSNVIFIEFVEFEYLKQSHKKWEKFISVFIPEILEKASFSMKNLKIVMWMNTMEYKEVYEAFRIKDRINSVMLDPSCIKSSLTDSELHALYHGGNGLRAVADEAARRAVQEKPTIL